MKTPSKCPVCNDIILNKYTTTSLGPSILMFCVKKLNHKITFSALENNPYELITMGIVIDDLALISAHWDFYTQKFYIRTSSHPGIIPQYMPYFEPDLSDYKRLLEKINTYLIFS